MAQTPRQLPGDARNVHRRTDDAEFYLVDIPYGTIPSTPMGMVQDTDEWREWRLLNIELIHARQILNVQLAAPHNTPENFRLAWDFWWRVATQHEQARNAHAFAYHGIRRPDGENAEGIPELVQNLPSRIQAMEQRAAAQNTGNQQQLISNTPLTNPYASQSTPVPPNTAQQSATTADNRPRPTVPGARGDGGGPTNNRPLGHHTYQPTTSSNLNPHSPAAQQQAFPRPHPDLYPALQRPMATDGRGSQPHRPPFSRPRHWVFWYWGRDLSGTRAALPRLPDGRNMFVRNTVDQTDRGWGPGVAVHGDIRAEVAAADEMHTSEIVRMDAGPLRRQG